MKQTKYFDNLENANEYIFSELKGDIHCGAPLGLGKPNQLLNLIYQTFKNNPQRNLKISTALSLEIPHPKGLLEKRFSEPYLKRHFGENYPELQYVLDAKKNLIPKNIQIHEFYIQAAQNLNIESAQRNYTSLNYTHVAQNLFDQNMNLIVQLIAKKPNTQRYSLSCNPDLTLDLADLYKSSKKRCLVVGVVHPDLPFMDGDAEVSADFFDAVLDSAQVSHKLFALPQYPLETQDFLIGLYASQFLQDDGTIQIGIGSLSDAIVHATLMRHQKNADYLNVLEKLYATKPKPKVNLYNNKFDIGLYGTSELVTDAFMYLREAKILKRKIFDLDQNLQRYLHGAFFLGSEKLYQWLRNLSHEDRAGFSMTRVSKVNDLYDHNEYALRRQRQKACFFNTCMSVDLLGGAASDTLPNGQVISGVGGQYNFVAMSRELPDSKSILLLRSTHVVGGKRTSSISFGYPHLTIPRHLRDIVITEYGIADLKGKTDEQVICALIEIADSEFQKDLIEIAKKNKKISSSYELPAWASQNTPSNLEKFRRSMNPDLFPDFPFQHDFTAVEESLVLALSKLKQMKHNPLSVLKLFKMGLTAKSGLFEEQLKRMGLNKTSGFAEWVYKNLVIGALLQSKNG